MRTFNVAMVAACPFPANHGTPAAIREMSEELVLLGHSIHVVTYPLKEDIPVKGVTIHRVRMVGKSKRIVVGPSYQRLAFDALMIPKLCNVIRKHRIDIIHAHNYEGALVGFSAKKMTGVPMIYNAINTMIDELPSYGFIKPKSVAVTVANILDTTVPKMADYIIADTEELLSFILNKGVSPDRIEVIPSGVHVEMFEKGIGSRARHDLAIGARPLVIYTGTFDSFQGLDYLLKAFKTVYEEYPDAVLLLLGSTVNPEHQQYYRTMARNLGFEKNLVITSSTLDRLPDFLAAADVVVSPRLSSPGIPTKLLNYMAAAKAIVSFEGSAKGLTNMVNALIVESGNSAAFGRAIVRLLADRRLAQELEGHAKEAIKGTYDWKSVAKKIERTYNFLVK
jgi:glycosyltransferase involved in cell wall biosynthesis